MVQREKELQNYYDFKKKKTNTIFLQCLKLIFQSKHMDRTQQHTLPNHNVCVENYDLNIKK